MTRFLLAVAAVTVGFAAARAGGPPPVYVLVDEVVVEPSKGDPERVTIRGVFARLKEGKGAEYTAPVEGSVHFTLNKDKSGDQEKELKQWAKAAGTGRVVPVGMCGDAGSFLDVKIRKADERPKAADATYTTGYIGATETTGGKQACADMEPVKALLAFAKERAAKKEKADATPPKK